MWKIDKTTVEYYSEYQLLRIGGDGQASRQATKDLEMVAALNPEVVLETAKNICRDKKKRNNSRKIGWFRKVFGTYPFICSKLWTMIDPINTISSKSLVRHLLYGLLFMKSYSTESVHVTLVGCDEKTFRKWAFLWIDAIADLEYRVILWENRYLGDPAHWTFVLDGIHFRVNEPSPFWGGWKSHKFGSAGVSYEVATAVTTGLIVSINGPFPAGKWNDKKIFNSYLIHEMDEGEIGVADRGYRGSSDKLLTPWWPKNDIRPATKEAECHERLRARHEQTNRRITSWNALSIEFRHNVKLHRNMMVSSCVIVNLEMMHYPSVWH